MGGADRRRSSPRSGSAREDLIVVTGLCRSGTTWLGNLVSGFKPYRYINEPFSHWKFAECSKRFRSVLDQLHAAGAHHRWDGHNDGLVVRPEVERAVLRAFRALAWEYRDPEVAKILTLPYWALARRVWPNMRLIYIEREAHSWLSSIVRSPDIFQGTVYSPWAGPEVWRSRTYRLLPVGHRLYPLLCCLMHRKVALGGIRKALAEEAHSVYSVTYENLLGDTLGVCTGVCRYLGIPGIAEVPPTEPRREVDWSGCYYQPTDLDEACRLFDELVV